MIVLLVAYDIDHLVNGIVAVTQFGGADVLGHVDRSAVTAEKQFVVESFTGKVGPYRAVFLAVHFTCFEAFENFLLAFEVCFALIIDFVEVDTHALVGLIESGVDPGVHHFPKRTDFRIFVFPFYEHFAGFFHERRCCFGFFFAHAFLFKFLELGFVVLVKEYIEVAYKMVAFLAGGFRSGRCGCRGH